MATAIPTRGRSPYLGRNFVDPSEPDVLNFVAKFLGIRPLVKTLEEFVQLSRSSDLIQMIARLDELLISS